MPVKVLKIGNIYKANSSIEFWSQPIFFENYFEHSGDISSLGFLEPNDIFILLDKKDVNAFKILKGDIIGWIYGSNINVFVYEI